MRDGCLGYERLCPQPCRGDRRHRARQAGQAQLKRDPSAERVSGNVGPVDAERRELLGDRGREGARMGLTIAQRPGLAKSRQVDGDHLALAAEQRHERVPDPPVGAERVQEHEHRATASSTERPQPGRRRHLVTGQ
jgi:hypothetical protein